MESLMPKPSSISSAVSIELRRVTDTNEHGLVQGHGIYIASCGKIGYDRHRHQPKPLWSESL